MSDLIMNFCACDYCGKDIRECDSSCPKFKFSASVVDFQLQIEKLKEDSLYWQRKCVEIDRERNALKEENRRLREALIEICQISFLAGQPHVPDETQHTSHCVSMGCYGHYKKSKWPDEIAKQALADSSVGSTLNLS